LLYSNTHEIVGLEITDSADCARSEYQGSHEIFDSNSPATMEPQATSVVKKAIFPLSAFSVLDTA
jgi:hypothetical protein